MDTIAPEDRQARIDDFVRRFRGRGRSALPIGKVFAISGLTREGCEALMLEVHAYLESLRAPEAVEVDPRFATAVAAPAHDAPVAAPREAGS